MAQENPRWGYTRIQGALANLSYEVGRATIANVLKRNGIEPSPERSRRTSWSTFLKAHWKPGVPGGPTRTMNRLQLSGTRCASAAWLTAPLVR
jgi:hypothetical protein